jgi:hypothetical protein
MELSMLSRFALSALVLSTLIACGVSEDEFSTEYVGHTCDLTFECSDEAVLPYLPYTDAADCKAQLGETDEVEDAEDTCDFDKGLAAECLDAMAAVTCDDWNTGNLPASCTNVCGDTSAS